MLDYMKRRRTNTNTNTSINRSVCFRTAASSKCGAESREAAAYRTAHRSDALLPVGVSHPLHQLGEDVFPPHKVCCQPLSHRLLCCLHLFLFFLSLSLYHHSRSSSSSLLLLLFLVLCDVVDVLDHAPHVRKEAALECVRALCDRDAVDEAAPGRGVRDDVGGREANAALQCCHALSSRIALRREGLAVLCGDCLEERGVAEVEEGVCVVRLGAPEVHLELCCAAPLGVRAHPRKPRVLCVDGIGLARCWVPPVALADKPHEQRSALLHNLQAPLRVGPPLPAHRSVRRGRRVCDAPAQVYDAQSDPVPLAALGKLGVHHSGHHVPFPVHVEERRRHKDPCFLPQPSFHFSFACACSCAPTVVVADAALC